MRMSVVYVVIFISLSVHVERLSFVCWDGVITLTYKLSCWRVVPYKHMLHVLYIYNI
jgi:hypothetical protein